MRVGAAVGHRLQCAERAAVVALEVIALAFGVEQRGVDLRGRDLVDLLEDLVEPLDVVDADHRGAQVFGRPPQPTTPAASNAYRWSIDAT